jgi:DnaJ-class molecular chaperone
VILGDFTEEELKKAYKRQSKKWHPDRNGGSNEVFQLVSLAYETLRDRTRRAAYDAGEDVERGTKHDGSEGLLSLPPLQSPLYGESL